MIKSLIRVLCCIFVLLPFNSFAQDAVSENANKKSFKFLFGIGLTAGGEDLLDVKYTDGSSEEMESGGLFDIKLGALYRLADSPVSFQTTLGYHGDSIEAQNGDASFSRLPIDFITFYNKDKHRFGLGGTYHLNTNLEIDLPDLKGDLDFDNALGGVVEYGYSFDKNVIFGVRYVDIAYTIENTSLEIDGSHFGLYVYTSF